VLTQAIALVAVRLTLQCAVAQVAAVQGDYSRREETAILSLQAKKQVAQETAQVQTQMAQVMQDAGHYIAFVLLLAASLSMSPTGS